MRQLKMFAPAQCKCMECRSFFVPWSKDVVALWVAELSQEEDWLYDEGWANDRVYKENLKCCGNQCMELYYIRHTIEELDREERAIKRNYR
jgi:hypothetical protein